MKKLHRILTLSLTLVMLSALMAPASAFEWKNTAAGQWTEPDVNISGWDYAYPGSWNPWNTDEKKVEIRHDDFSLDYDISYSEDGSICNVTQKVITGDTSYELNVSMTNWPTAIKDKNFEATGQMQFRYAPAGVWKDYAFSWKRP